MTTTLSHHELVQATTLSAEARVRMEAFERTPLMYSDWVRALFMHYEVAPEVLQPVVPIIEKVRDEQRQTRTGTTI